MRLPGAKRAPADFDGATYEPEHDRKRLGRQLQAVRDLMQDGVWRTLEDIQSCVFWRASVSATTQSISARLRDLRKAKFGAHTVNRRRLSGGIYEYRLLVRD